MKHHEQGQSLVETAVTLPILLLLLLGAVELGQVIFGAINVSNAAKSASQYGAQTSETMVDTQGMLIAAQNEAFIPDAVSPLDMPIPTTMPDGSAVPSVADCSNSYTQGSTTSYACTYCTCSNPDVTAPPFACATAVASGPAPTCTGVSHLEQNLIIETHASIRPAISIPGLPSTYNLYGHAVVKRLQ